MTQLNRISLRAAVEKLSKEVGDWIKSQHVSRSEIELKSFNSLVSYVDKEAERMFVEKLSELLPEAGFIAEEGTSDKKGERYNWVIDPLDGTTNFLYQIPCYCTSVALLDGDEVVLGVIYDPNENENFSAQKGQGATLNGKPCGVSNNPNMRVSLIATGFPYEDFGRQNPYMELLKEFTQNTRGIRRLGSAAIDLAYVACGRFDAFYEYGLKPWDMAAGILIVREAGGEVTQFDGDPKVVFGKDILATNEKQHKQLLSTIKRYFPNS